MSDSPDIKTFAIASGADLAGIADLGPFKQGWTVLPPDLLAPYTYAVSVAVRLDDTVINAIEKGPTVAYADHYRDANVRLDGITARIVRWITERGHRASAVPASSITDETNLLGGISHKAVARMAGIGWQGKSLLIISPRFGPRIRLATVLTDMPLPADQPLKNRCGTCRECSKACPASAIKNISTQDRYESREDALHFGRCVEMTLHFKELPGIGARICGVCVKVCPFGKRGATHGGKTAGR
jgi:epoxyqueuosine reductase